MIKFASNQVGYGLYKLNKMQSQDNGSELEVYMCSFEVNIQQASMTIKFPCSYSIEIKSLNNKITMAATKNKVSAINSIATFSEVHKFETQLLYHTKQKHFVKKEVLLLLNLISARRPDQNKLVGRITIDLSQVIHSQLYSQMQSHKLDYCSVNASIMFNLKLIGKKLSSTTPQNFDRDSFSDFQSFVAGIHKQASPHKQKSYDEGQKTVELPWKSKASEGIDKNKIIEQSYNEEGESRANTGRTSHKLVPHEENIPKPPISGQSDQDFGHRFTLGAESANQVPYNRKAQNYVNPNYEQSNLQAALTRVRSDLPERTYSNKKLSSSPSSQQAFFTQPINQYQQILRTSHAQQKRIWDQQKRLLNEQISKEKQQNGKHKQRNDALEKKLYETQFKLCTVQGKMENSKRQMTILEREKDLQIKQLKSKIQKFTKQKNDKLQGLESKQMEIRQLKQQLKLQEIQKRKNADHMTKQNERLQQKLQNASKQISNLQKLIRDFQLQKKQSQKQLFETEQKYVNIQNQLKVLQSKLKQNQNKNIQKVRKLETQLKNKLEKQQESLKEKINELEQICAQNQFKLNDLNLQLQSKSAELKKKNSEYTQGLKKNRQLQQQQLNKVITENQKIIEELNAKNMQLQLQVQQFSLIIDRLQSEIKTKDTQLKLQTNHTEEKQKLLSKRQQQHKQYTQGLQQNILKEKQKLKKQEQQNQKLLNDLKMEGKKSQQLNKEIEKLKQNIKGMKEYEQGLEQQLLNLHESNSQNNSKFQQQLNNVIQKQKQIAGRYTQFEEFATLRIKELQGLVEQRNIELNDRNYQIQKLSKDINDKSIQIQKLSKEKAEASDYIMGIEAELLKLNENVQQQAIKAQSYLKNNENLKAVLSKNEENNAQVQTLKQTILQQKEYQRGLQEQVLKMHQQILKGEETVKKLGLEKEENYKGQIQVLNSKLMQFQQKLNEQIMKAFEAKINQQKAQQENWILKNQLKQLQDKINKQQIKVVSNDENKQKIKGQQIESIKKKLQQSQQKLKEQQQYATGLEEQLLMEQEGRVEGQRFFEDQIKNLQKAIEEQKQYSRGLEQRILLDCQPDVLASSQREQQLLQKIQQLQKRLQHQIQYTQGLEEKILADHEELKQSQNLKRSFNNIQRDMASKIQQLQKSIEQHKQYQEGLEQRILCDHENLMHESNIRNSLTINQIELNSKVKQLENKIQKQKEYQEGLEQRILEDHEIAIDLMKNSVVSNKELQLSTKIKDLQNKIEYHKEYQQGLQQKILDDHESVVEAMKNGHSQTEKQLSKKIKILQTTIERQKQYQEGLQQKILEDHENRQSQNVLKNSIDLLNSQLKQNKQYQQGLQQKILTDYEKLQIMEKKYNDLLATLEHKGTQNQQPKPSANQKQIHKKCQQEKRKMQLIIEQLEQNLYKISESPIKRDDEDYLVLQQKLNEKESAINEIELQLKIQQSQVLKLQQKIVQLEAQIEELVKQKQQNENIHQQPVSTVIRVISVHTPSEVQQEEEKQKQKFLNEGQNNLDKLTSLLKGSMQKSQMSQPPSLMEKASQLSDDYSYQSSPRKNQQQIMVMQTSQNKQKDCAVQQQIQSRQNLQKQFENKINQLNNIISKKQQQIEEIRQQIQAKDLKIANLDRIVKEVTMNNEKLQKSIKQLQKKSNLKQQLVIKKLQAKIQELQTQSLLKNEQQQLLRAKILQWQNNQKSESHNNSNVNIGDLKQYIGQLQYINKQYETRIHWLKQKQVKMEYALSIIEEESQKFVEQFEKRAKQLQELRELLNNKNQQCEQLLQIVSEAEKKKQQIQSQKESLSSLVSQNQKKGEQISELRKKLSMKSQGVSKYEELLAEVQTNNKQQQQKERKNQQKIKKLQDQLNSVSQQLSTNRKLFAKLRGNVKQSTTSFEEDPKLAAIVQQKNNLAKRVEDLQKLLSNYQNQQQDSNREIQILNKQLTFLTQELQQLKQKQKLLPNPTDIGKLDLEVRELQKKVQQKEEKGKFYEAEIAKLQSLMKVQRLQYYSKRRQLSQQKQNHSKQNQILKQQLEDMERTANSLKGELMLVNNKLAEQIERSKAAQQLKKSLSQNQIKLQLQLGEIALQRKNSMKHLQYIKELQRLIAQHDDKINRKNEQIQKLRNDKSKVEEGKQNGQLKQLQNQLNFYSEELALVTRKYEQLESTHNAQKLKIEQLESQVEELNNEIQFAHQQNELQQNISNKQQKNNSLLIKKLEQEHLQQKNALLQKLQQIQIEFDQYKNQIQIKQKQSGQRMNELKQELRNAIDEKDKAIQQLQEKQMQHMNAQLDLQFKLREKNEKSQAEIAKSMENPNRKSLNASQDVGTNDLIPASKILKQLIISRASKTIVEKQIQVMVARIAQLESQLHNPAAVTKEKGLILEKTRLMSMEFSKFKVSIMKSKLPNEERMKCLTTLRPLENTIKEILKLAQIHSQNLFSQDFVGESPNN